MSPYEQALSFLVERLGAERALVLAGEGELAVKGCHGLDQATVFTGAPLSLTLLRDVRHNGRPLLLGDARADPLFKDCFSLQVSGIRSVLCVPFWGPAGAVFGLLYADCRKRAGLFSRADMESAVWCARRLEGLLFHGETRPLTEGMPVPMARPPAPRTAQKPAAVALPAPDGLRPEAPRKPGSSGLPVAGALAHARPRPAALVAYLRALAVAVGAGLPLTRALRTLGGFDDDPRLARISLLLEEALQAGYPLSRALSLFPGTFSSTDVSMIRMGEKSGTLHQVLDQLASYQERMRATYMKLTSALTYPACVLAACLLLVLLVPPYLLDGQFRVLVQSGQTPPLITRFMMTLSAAMRGWPFWVLLAGLGLGAVLGLRRLLANPSGRRLLWRVARRVPALGAILVAFSAARFARSLGILIQIGYPLLDALPLAAASSLDPVLEEAIPRAVAALREGQTLAPSLDSTGCLSRTFVELVRVGEETGSLPELLAWLAGFCEQEFETGLESLIALLEPLIVMGMGILVALLLIATLLPMVSVVENL